MSAREQLAEVIRDGVGTWRTPLEAADAILKAGLIREARAAELETAAEAAEGMHDPVAPDCLEWADWLRARAAAIRAGQA